MAKRRYTSKCSRYTIHLNLQNGIHIVHEFKGKNVYTKERYTDVTDPEIQRLLESSTGFGVYFEKSHEFDYLEAEEKAEKEKAYKAEQFRLKQEAERVRLEEDSEEGDVGDIEDDGDKGEAGPENTDKVKVFATGADAKFWLNQTMKVPVLKLGNKAKMIVEAELLGYTIEFEEK